MDKSKNRSSDSSSSYESRNNSKVQSKNPPKSASQRANRLATQEQPTSRKSKSPLTYSSANVHDSTKQLFKEPYLDSYEDGHISSGVDIDNLHNPLGKFRTSDGHIREIYRLPTPPPQVKRVYHRARSPKTKIIERIFVRRAAPEIIEKIIEIPPQRVRIINREKLLPAAKPIIHTKVVYLRPHHDTEYNEQQEIYDYSESYTPKTVASTYAPIMTQPNAMNHQVIQPIHYDYGITDMSANYYGHYY